MNKTHTTMKKAIFLVAVATIALLSCQKENETTGNLTDNNRITFKASIEAFSDETKATLGSENALVWKGGDINDTDNQPDRIGIYVNDASWEQKNQPFHLNSTTDVEEGEFVYDYDGGNFTNTNATAAFFPWEGTGSDKNNVYDGVAYFKLRDAYWSYDNNKMLTPLVAPITYTNNAVNQPIKFKHAGAAVKLTLNNLPSGTYKVKMSVDGKQITGGFHVNPANAGSEALALDEAEDVTKNTVTLNTWKSSGAFNWIFPVPELTKPKLAFEILDENGIPIWSRSLKAQKNDVKRGEILAMPALDITPYAKFVQDNTTWTFSGNINGSSWKDNVPMVTDGKYWILSGFTFKEGDEFKIRKDNKWDEAYPSSNWVITAAYAGTKDIIFDKDDPTNIRVVDHKCPYPTVVLPTSISIDGSFDDWDAVAGATSGNHTVKVASDATNIYFYSHRDADTRYPEIWGADQAYIYIGLDLDNDSTTGTGDIWGNGPYEFIALMWPYAGSSTSPAFNESPTSSWQCSPTTYSIANLALKGKADSTNGVSIEFSIPRSDLPTIPTTSITIKFFGYSKALSEVTLSRTL